MVDVTGSTMFTTASPDFPPDTCAHVWREQGPDDGPANSGVLTQMPIELHGAGL